MTTERYRFICTRRPPQGKDSQSGFLPCRDFTCDREALAVEAAHEMATETGLPVLVRRWGEKGTLISTLGTFDGTRRVRFDRGVRRA